MADTVKLTDREAERPMRRYSVTIDGFDPVTYIARSAGAARYRCWKAWTDAGYGRGWTFRDFVKNATTLHHGPAGRTALTSYEDTRK
jgi:hypothetical protein